MGNGKWGMGNGKGELGMENEKWRIEKGEWGIFKSHKGTQIVCTVSIPESPLHFLRLLV